MSEVIEAFEDITTVADGYNPIPPCGYSYANRAEALIKEEEEESEEE